VGEFLLDRSQEFHMRKAWALPYIIDNDKKQRYGILHLAIGCLCHSAHVRVLSLQKTA